MSTEKSLAIVLRVVDFSESSCVVTLFSEGFGKLSALAKGARRPKGPFESALDVLSLCRIVFIRKSSDALDLLTEAKLERRFRAASRDLSRLYAAYYVTELLDGLTDTGDPHPELFAIAEETLCRLNGQDSIEPLILRYELTTLNLLGHLPSLERCVGCGRVITQQGSVAFGQSVGGVLCSECRPGQRHVARVSVETIQILKRYADPNSDPTRNSAQSGVAGGEIRGVINHYLAHLMGKRPRMHKYLGMLGS